MKTKRSSDGVVTKNDDKQYRARSIMYFSYQVDNESEGSASL